MACNKKLWSVLTIYPETLFFCHALGAWPTIEYILRYLEGYYADTCYDVGLERGCPEQDVIFSRMYSLTYISLNLNKVVGALILDYRGMWWARSVSAVLLKLGLVALIFSTPANPWLVWIGLFLFVGYGTSMLFLNLNNTNFYPAYQGLTISFIAGCTGTSQFIYTIVKNLIENSDGQFKFWYLWLIILILTPFLWFRTFFLNPKYMIPKEVKDDFLIGWESRKQKTYSYENMIKNNGANAPTDKSTPDLARNRTLSQLRLRTESMINNEKALANTPTINYGTSHGNKVKSNATTAYDDETPVVPRNKSLDRLRANSMVNNAKALANTPAIQAVDEAEDQPETTATWKDTLLEVFRYDNCLIYVWFLFIDIRLTSFTSQFQSWIRWVSDGQEDQDRLISRYTDALNIVNLSGIILGPLLGFLTLDLWRRILIKKYGNEKYASLFACTFSMTLVTVAAIAISALACIRTPMEIHFITILCDFFIRALLYVVRNILLIILNRDQVFGRVMGMANGVAIVTGFLMPPFTKLIQEVFDGNFVTFELIFFGIGLVVFYVPCYFIWRTYKEYKKIDKNQNLCRVNKSYSEDL